MSAKSFGFSNVNLTFGSTPVFSGVSLEVHQGDSVVLIGPSGHGKTCLLKLMAGLLPPSSGRVHVDGQDLYGLEFEARSALTRKMGMLFQKNALFDSLSVYDNVAFPLRETENLEDEGEVQSRVLTLLEAVGLTHAQDLLPHEISGGMQKRLGIARALALRPKIVFYDDPTAGLDPMTSRHIVRLILNLQRENSATQVIVTNDMNRAYELSTRIFMVVEGELLEVGDRESALRHADPRVYQFVRGQVQGPLQAV